MQERLVKDYGEKSLVLSTANTNSYAKRRMTLKQYTAQIVDRPTTLSDRGDSTFYHFGDNDHTSVLLLAPYYLDWCVTFISAQFQALFATYVLPPWHATNTTAPHPSLSFGFAGHGTCSMIPFLVRSMKRRDLMCRAGSGVPLHTHGAVFAEVLHGRKVVPYSVLCLLALVSFCNFIPTKRWFLYPPSYKPLFDPNETTLR
jgi:hypothetical protein